ncbi:MAG: InlB B-repeat-containing protein [Actinomycetota bacterium]|nr:InlB B-repeat-containing protein [Actinomycetota bacterium]
MRPARTHVRRAFALLLASCLLLCQMPAVAFADADQGGAHKDVTPSVVESEAGQDGLPYASDGDAVQSGGEGAPVESDHALTNDGYTLTGELVEDDVIKSIDVVGAQTTVGTSENVPSNAVIVNTPGDDVTSNYDISYVNGTLEVTKAPLTITANDQTYTYNGETQGEGDTAYEDPAEIAEKVTVKGLQGSDALTSIVLDGQGKEVGVYELVPSNAAVGEATGNYDITYVNGKLTITPTYTVTYRVVGGTWSDGTTADRTETVASGESPASVPTGMVASPGFTGGAWDNDPAGAAITGDATFTYAFEAIPKHTIRFVNEDGTELQSGLVAYGETPTYTGEPPTKPATAQFTYTFAGWTPEVVPVEADATYTATYEATPITATLTFDLAGGTLDGKTGTVTITANVGDTIAIPAAPTRKGYVFRYWKGSEYHPGDPYEVTGDHTFTAMWEKAADASPDQSGGKASPTTPATGDDSTMLVVALSVAALGLLCLLAALDVRCRAHRGRHSR